jgi:hypothetical protein
MAVRHATSGMAAALCALGLATSCADGGGTENGSFRPPPGNYVHLESDVGDYIGGGSDFTYTQADSAISIAVSGNQVNIGVQGDEYWEGAFQEPSGLTSVRPGTYAGVQRYPLHEPDRGGMVWWGWWGETRFCNTITGSFTVESVTWVEGEVTALDLSFEQHCEESAPALRGRIHWAAGDPTAPPGPVTPPEGLWDPGAAVTSGNYVHLESDAGDPVGAGGTYTYTQATAFLGVYASGSLLMVDVHGDEWWVGRFRAMTSLTELHPGYYGGLEGEPFHNPARGVLSWRSTLGACPNPEHTGWVVVDAVTYSGTVLTAIDLRFEQRCEGGAPPLRGEIHWAAGDPTAPPGPVTPPEGLWDPGAVVTSGNYVHLESDAGDWVGAGETYTYTQATADLSVTGSGNLLMVDVGGDEWWVGRFQAMSSLTDLQPGYYGNLQLYDWHNPARGGLRWWGEDRGCLTATGWFVVDSVTYSGGTLTAIDLRFEQRCDGGAPALRGKIHWAP